MTIAERWDYLSGRPSGFDYMRLGLSIFVLLWHSYQMSYGTPAALMFWRDSLLGPLIALILPIFFSLSGFLVSGSLYRNPKVRVFLTLRAIRIFPALAVEVTLSALILGPILTIFNLNEYFTSKYFFGYLTNVVGWVHYSLPGVFLSNPNPGTVNPSLWTIPFELECYILISFLATVGMFSRRVLVLPLFLVATAIVFSWNVFQDVDPSPAGGVNGRVLVLCFFGGIVIYAYRNLIPWRKDLAICALLGAMIFTRYGQLVYITPLFAAYLTVYIGLLNPRRTIVINAGDFSYGTYLYAGPIQQTVAQLLGTSGSWALNVAFALPITIVFALFSWWAVEKPFLKIRSYLGAKSTPKPTNTGLSQAVPIRSGARSG